MTDPEEKKKKKKKKKKPVSIVGGKLKVGLPGESCLPFFLERP